MMKRCEKLVTILLLVVAMLFINISNIFATPEEETAYDFVMPNEWFQYPLQSNDGNYIHKSVITKVKFDKGENSPSEYIAHFEVCDEEDSEKTMDCYVLANKQLIIHLGNKINTLYTPEDATNFFGGFEEVEKYENIDLLNTSNTKDFQSFFKENFKVKSLDLTSFDTSNATNMISMFHKMNSLTEIDLSSFDTSNVTEMNLMFAQCNSLTELDLSNFSSGSLGCAQAMFSGMTKIAKIYASDEFDISQLERDKRTSAFYNCNNLVGTYGFDMQKALEYVEKHPKNYFDATDFARLDTKSTVITDRGLFTDKDEDDPEFIETEEDEVEEETTEAETTSDEEEEETDVVPPEIKTYEVVLEINGGEFVESFDLSKYAAVEVETQIDLPDEADVYKEGYNFKGWYKNPDLTGTNIKAIKFSIEGSVTVYAKWQKIPTYYTVEFELNSGEFKPEVNLSRFTDAITGIEITLPTEEDMIYVSTADVEAEFDGWYRNSDFTDERLYKIGKTDEGNVTLYAKWNVTEYATIEIGPAVRDRCLFELDPSVKPDYSSLYVGGTYLTLRVKKGDTIIVPELNNSIFFRTYNYNTYDDEWTGFVCTGYRVMRRKNLRMSYDQMIYKPGDEFVVAEDGLIMFGGSSYTLAGGPFTRQEIINKYGEPCFEVVGRDQPFKTVVTQNSSTTKSSSNSTSSSSTNSGGSGGSGGGGAALNPLSMNMELTPLTAMANPLQLETVQMAPNAVNNQQEAKTASDKSFVFNSNDGAWKQNADGTWGMTLSVNGVNVVASNGFYNLVTNDVTTGLSTNAVYYFDEQGQMATGWVKDANNNIYFFETLNNNDVGKMITGWKEINGSAYYFGADGKMLTNAITPDGKYVGADGKISY